MRRLRLHIFLRNREILFFRELSRTDLVPAQPYSRFTVAKYGEVAFGISVVLTSPSESSRGRPKK